MFEIVIKETDILEITDQIISKLKKMRFKNDDPAELSEDATSLAIAICIRNKNLIRSAYYYLKNGEGFKYSCNTYDMWKDFERWCQELSNCADRATIKKTGD